MRLIGPGNKFRMINYTHIEGMILHFKHLGEMAFRAEAGEAATLEDAVIALQVDNRIAGGDPLSA